MARAKPTIRGPLTAHDMQLQLTAKQSVDSMTSFLKLLLALIQKFTSHISHVFIRDLIRGAKAGRSLLFTRIVEHRNQYLAKHRSTPTYIQAVLRFGYFDFHTKSFCARK
jgi:hypothetical protein